MTRPRKGRRKEHLESSLKREVSVMKRIRHPNIVTLWEAISDPRSRKVNYIQCVKTCIQFVYQTTLKIDEGSW